MKFNAHAYKEYVMRYDKDNGDWYFHKGDGLWAIHKSGNYATKIKPEDLPDCYIPLCVSGRTMYVSAKGIKHIAYKPNYLFNHVFKDDFLYISYDEPIIMKEAKYCNAIEGYDIALWGPAQYDFIETLEKSGWYDVSLIKKAMEEKIKWFKNNNDNPEPDFKKHKMFINLNLESPF